MTNKEPLVKLTDVEMNFSKSRGFFKRQANVVNALHDIDFEIHPGEVVVVVGESGSGKTTMANVLAGLLKPSEGTFSYEGQDYYKMDRSEHVEYHNQVQMVQQDSYAALNPMRRIIDSIGDPLILKGVATKENVRDVLAGFLETVDLTPADNFLYKYPHQLSGGQRQRVLMARAISMNPKLILADEPVSMIDVSLRIQILNILSKLNTEKNIAIMYITHDLATARYVGQEGRIAVMYLGQIVETGKLTSVLADPQHPYLQALLYAVPSPDPRIARLERKQVIQNPEENTGDIPTGCRFHNRCAYCQERCVNEVPEMRRSGNSEVACHFAGELPEFTLYKEAAKRLEADGEELVDVKP